MSRRINQIQNIFFASILVFHLDGVTLNGNAALAFQIHIIKNLVLGNRDRLGKLEQTVSQSGLTVIDMRNDTKVADILHI